MTYTQAELDVLLPDSKSIHSQPLFLSEDDIEKRQQYEKALFVVAGYLSQNPIDTQIVAGTVENPPPLSRLQRKITDEALKVAGFTREGWNRFCDDLNKPKSEVEFDLAKYLLWFSSRDDLDTSERYKVEAAELEESVMPDRKKLEAMIQKLNALQEEIDEKNNEVNAVLANAKNRRTEATRHKGQALRKRRSVARETGRLQFDIAAKSNRLLSEIASITEKSKGEISNDTRTLLRVRKNRQWAERRLYEADTQLRRVKKESKRESRFWPEKIEAEKLLARFDDLQQQRTELLQKFHAVEREKKALAEEWTDRPAIDSFQRKVCSQCSTRVAASADFCPRCGHSPLDYEDRAPKLHELSGAELGIESKVGKSIR